MGEWETGSEDYSHRDFQASPFPLGLRQGQNHLEPAVQASRASWGGSGYSHSNRVRSLTVKGRFHLSTVKKSYGKYYTIRCKQRTLEDRGGKTRQAATTTLAPGVFSRPFTILLEGFRRIAH